MKLYWVLLCFVILHVTIHNSLSLPVVFDSTTDSALSITSDPTIDLNSKTVEFNLTLPNKDILKVNISFVMMKESEILENRDDFYIKNETDDTDLSTSTTTIIPIESEEKYFTVDEAIEAFRKRLITKEADIGGILDAAEPFYRHFNLQYEDLNIPIRCTYDSNYMLRQLKISCFEYREIEQERILSNGEIEKVRVQDLKKHLENIVITDIENYTQTYKMEIS